MLVSPSSGFVSFLPGSFSRSAWTALSQTPDECRGWPRAGQLSSSGTRRRGGPGSHARAGARPVRREQSAQVSGLASARCPWGLQVQVAPDCSCTGLTFAESVWRAELLVPSVLLLSRPVCVSPGGSLTKLAYYSTVQHKVARVRSFDHSGMVSLRRPGWRAPGSGPAPSRFWVAVLPLCAHVGLAPGGF